MRRAPERMLSLFVGITLAGIIAIVGWKKFEPIANVILPVVLILGPACYVTSWVIRWRSGEPEHTFKAMGSSLFMVVLVIVAWIAVVQFALGILPVLFSLMALFYYLSRVVMR